MPKENDVANKFLNIIRRTDFDLTTQKELAMLPAAVKWNLIQKHKKAVDQQELIIEEEEDKGESYADLFNSKCQLSDLILFYDWLSEDNEDAIASFISHNGMHIIVTHLVKASEESM